MLQRLVLPAGSIVPKTSHVHAAGTGKSRHSKAWGYFWTLGCNTVTLQHISTFWCTFLLLFRSLYMESVSRKEKTLVPQEAAFQLSYKVPRRTYEGPSLTPLNFGCLAAELSTWRLLLLSAQGNRSCRSSVQTTSCRQRLQLSCSVVV